MNLKKAVAGVSLAGGLGLALMGVGSGEAYAAPGGGGCMPPVTSVGRVARVTSVGRVARVTSVGRVVPATSDGGLLTPSAASVVLRGVMEQRRGAGERRRRSGGAGRCRRRAECGTKGRSTTGATTSNRYGIRAKTGGVSISSESGSRCNKPAGRAVAPQMRGRPSDASGCSTSEWQLSSSSPSVVAAPGAGDPWRSCQRRGF
jgi:hypothetical protein